MEIKKLTATTIEIRCPIGDQDYLLMPDVHFDNPKCNRELFFKLMDEARERDAKVLFFGDLLCLMQGKYDPRRSKKHIRPEHNVSNYIDAVINDTAELLAPYAHNIVMFGEGNHEESIRRHLETDVLDRLAERINMNTGSKIYKMGYSGFLLFKMNQMVDDVPMGTVTKTAYWHHGKYGGAVTKGTIGTLRHSAVTPDADVIITGHTHDNWSMEVPRYRVSNKTGNVKIDSQIHLKVGTLKEEFAHMDGWAVERIVMPKSMRGWWLKLRGKREQHGNQIYITYEPTV